VVVIAGRCRITNRGRITNRSSTAPLPPSFLDLSLEDEFYVGAALGPFELRVESPEPELLTDFPEIIEANPLIYAFVLNYEGIDLLWQDPAGTTTLVTDPGDSIAAVRDLRTGEIVSTQSTSSLLPTWLGEGSGMQFTSRRLLLTFGQQFVGTMVVATTQLTYALEVQIPSGTYSFGLRGREVWPVLAVAFYESRSFGEFVDGAVQRFTSLGSGPLTGFSEITSLDNTWSSRTEITRFPIIDTSNVTNFRDAWRGCTGLTEFPPLDTSSGTDFRFTWYNCDGLTEFPPLNVSSGVDFIETWGECYGLTSFPLLDVSSGVNFAAAWAFCSGLTEFPPLDTSSGTDFFSAWAFCSGLTSFPPLDMSSGTDFSNTWVFCSGLTSFPLLDVSSGTKFFRAWEGCSGLTEFPLLDVSSGTNFRDAWSGCTGLTSFPLLDVSSGTNFFGAWRGCSGLTEFPLLDVSSGTNFRDAWSGCTGLTSFPLLDFSSVPQSSRSGLDRLNSGFLDAWSGCTSLATFPAGAFDGSPCRNFIGAFENCALTQQSVDNILISIESNGTTSGQIDLSGGTSAGPGPAGQEAMTALQGRFWIVSVNPFVPIAVTDAQVGMQINSELIASSAAFLNAAASLSLQTEMNAVANLEDFLDVNVNFEEKVYTSAIAEADELPNLEASASLSIESYLNLSSSIDIQSDP
jgi:hypothetical protein